MQAAVSCSGLPAFRGQQIAHWLYKKHVWDFAGMSNLPRQILPLLSERFSVLPARAAVLDTQLSANGLAGKLLIQLPDGNLVETVGMRHDYGNSVCVSSQVGCAMGCEFCASTLHGFIRDLSAAEMLLQVAFAHRYFFGGMGRVDRVVLMGSGEPLLNYGQAIKFLRLLHEPDLYGLGYRNITLSTCGVVPGIYRLTEERLPVNLAISLHAPLDGLRARLMPINKKYPVADVLTAARRYAETSGRQVTYEYLLLKGLNDSVLSAGQLARLLQGSNCAVNLIPFNRLPEKVFQSPTRAQVERFAAVLSSNGVTATVRKSLGADIQAACGQLRARRVMYDEKGC